ncbi:hypothetical protein [uncultured Gimesia sp.]|jgi:hypothetical protein|uniref:hypothetical protein n=1 Tax=uncultured Gimesia sp. TaxID=1678688 RepID=UPI002638F75B|nr:hypothetical protein [uncultured Gimesia sp.]
MRDCCCYRIYCGIALVSLLITGCGSGSPAPQAPVESEIVVSSESAISQAASKKTSQAASASPVNSSPKPGVNHTSNQNTADVKTSAEKIPEVLYRPSDQRPIHNNQRLALLGIHCYESPRLKLYTDIDPELAATLPAVIDQAYPALGDYFGPLPPDREGTEFQVTGYIMQNRELFQKAGVILESLPKIINGRHLGAQFWIDAQSENYYQRHLMLHEYTHCYSMIMENIGAPVWYLEGIAESMATHAIGKDGKIQFNVMPHNKDDFAGLGRISLIKEAVQTAPPKSMLEVMQFGPADFVNNNEAYAWSWALCQFFDKHPHYAKPFRELPRHMQGTQFSHKIQQLIDDDFSEINDAWLLFARNLLPGYDFERATIAFAPGLPIDPDASATATITSDHGWQSSGMHVDQGSTYELRAAGTFTLAEKPKPWESTANGISFRYFKGQPLGRLTMMIRPEPGASNPDQRSILQEYPLGANATWMATVSGTVYFRLNDAWNELADNQGSVTVTVIQKKNADSGPASKTAD